MFAEWVKYSLQLPIEEEVTRQNLVSLMFQYIGQMSHTYEDYRHLLKGGRFLLANDDHEGATHGFAIDDYSHIEEEEYEQDVNENSTGQEQVIEIEIREFRDLAQKRDIQEYCKPFSFEQLILDSDDICRIAVIITRKLLDNRIDEFSLSMLQCISDIKEQLEDEEPLPLNANDEVIPIAPNQDESQTISFKKQRDLLYKKLESSLDQVNELVTSSQDVDYSVSDLNSIMRKVRRYVALIEEINLKEKLSFKRALNLCLILLKQCRADVNDQNLVSICETLIAPTIASKDKDNMLLAIECIGLLCLLDRELFINYSTIFHTILAEDVHGTSSSTLNSNDTNLREKLIALRSSVDALIIHGVDPPSSLDGQESKTQKLQRIIVEDYMVIKDKVLRQVTIEGLCKMLFSRKLT